MTNVCLHKNSSFRILQDMLKNVTLKLRAFQILEKISCLYTFFSF